MKRCRRSASAVPIGLGSKSMRRVQSGEAQRIEPGPLGRRLVDAQQRRERATGAGRIALPLRRGRDLGHASGCEYEKQARQLGLGGCRLEQPVEV